VKIIRQISSLSLCAVLLCGGFDPTNQTWAAGADDEPKGEAPSPTIYNQQFAVVRQKVSLDLKVGVNHIQVSDPAPTRYGPSSQDPGAKLPQ
jgi:hypothetical protein